MENMGLNEGLLTDQLATPFDMKPTGERRVWTAFERRIVKEHNDIYRR